MKPQEHDDPLIMITRNPEAWKVSLAVLVGGIVFVIAAIGMPGCAGHLQTCKDYYLTNPGSGTVCASWTDAGVPYDDCCSKERLGRAK